MKKTTCRNLKGACDAVIVGENSMQMGENSKAHVMSMVSAGDEAHKQAIEAMMKLSQEEQQQWYQEFEKSFDTLPDA